MRPRLFGVSDSRPQALLPPDEEAPVELVHIVGFNDESSFRLHPTDSDILLFHVGQLIVIGSRKDPQNQTIMQGHDADVTTIDVSPDGKFVASGQKASGRFKGVAPVILWDFEAREQLGVFEGHIGDVTSIQFSEDSKYMAGSTRDRLIIWRVADREIVANEKMPKDITAFTWVKQEKGESKNNLTYTLAVASNNLVWEWTLAYHISMFSYRLHKRKLCPSGLIRHITCLSACRESRILSATTMSGDALIYHIDTRSLLTVLPPLATNGLTATVQRNGVFFCGAGDGQVVRMTGNRGTWSMDGSTTVPCGICKMQVAHDRVWVGTTSGKIYSFSLRLDDETLEMEGHTSPVVSVAIGSEPHLFTTIEKNGNISIWDLTNYKRVTAFRGPAEPVCLDVLNEHIYVGFANGALHKYERCTTAKGETSLTLSWGSDRAHRGRVTSVTVTEATLLLSGGDDGVLRLWRNNGTFVTQFQSHLRAINKIIADFRYDDLFHTCSADKQVATYTFRRERNVGNHQIHNGILTDMVQRQGGDAELITTISDGRVIVWDEDIVEAVHEIRIEGATECNALDLSPDGSTLAVAGDNVFLFSMQTFKMIAELRAHSGRVLSVKWTKDQKQLVSVADDSTCCVWNFYGGVTQTDPQPPVPANVVEEAGAPVTNPSPPDASKATPDLPSARSSRYSEV